MTTTVGLGGTIPLTVQFYAYAGGPAADPSAPTLKIYDPASTLVQTIEEAALNRTGVGAYSYDYVVPAGGDTGSWRAVWSGSIDGTEVSGLEFFNVVDAGDVSPGVDSNIITPEEVASMTSGASVDSDDIATAQTMIEVVAKRDLSSTGVSDRDRRYARQAVAYQAVWLKAHPEALVAADISSMSQTDHSVNFRDSYSQWLAPLARAALKRCSWMSSRSTTVQNGVSRSLSAAPGLIDAGTDVWRPIR